MATRKMQAHRIKARRTRALEVRKTFQRSDEQELEQIEKKLLSVKQRHHPRDHTKDPEWEMLCEKKVACLGRVSRGKQEILSLSKSLGLSVETAA